jgi:hypothetical protein
LHQVPIVDCKIACFPKDKMIAGSKAFPVPGTVLWAVDVDLENDIFRKGAATKPGVDFLRYVDLDIRDMAGRIEGDMAEKFVVAPGQGISLFLEKMVPEGMVLLDDTLRKTVEKSRQNKIHWWAIDQGHPIPSGLVLTYDGLPPGHCTLTVTREMTVKGFLALVAMVPFVPLGYELYGPI